MSTASFVPSVFYIEIYLVVALQNPKCLLQLLDSHASNQLSTTLCEKSSPSHTFHNSRKFGSFFEIVNFIKTSAQTVVGTYVKPDFRQKVLVSFLSGFDWTSLHFVGTKRFPQERKTPIANRNFVSKDPL